VGYVRFANIKINKKPYSLSKL